MSLTSRGPHRYVTLVRSIPILRLTSLYHYIQKEQGILQGRVSVLELNCSELQTSNRDLMESLEREKKSLRSAEATFQNQLFAEEKKHLALETATREDKILVEEARKKVTDLNIEIQKLQQEIAAAKTIQPAPSPPKDTSEDPDLVASLRADITRLESINGELVRKSETIEERYQNSCLVCSLLFLLAQSLIDRT